MTNNTGKIFSPWYKNINLQGFNNILAETWEKYVNCLGNLREIFDANIDKVLAVVKAQKVGNSI